MSSFLLTLLYICVASIDYFSIIFVEFHTNWTKKRNVGPILEFSKFSNKCRHIKKDDPLQQPYCGPIIIVLALLVLNLQISERVLGKEYIL